MRRLGRCGAILLSLAGGLWALPAAAAAIAGSGLEAPAWAIAPEDGACRTEFELTGHSGTVAPVALVSDGERVALRFAKQGAPAEAFLPIRIDQKPYANLVQRAGDEGLAVMVLSDSTLTALRRGKALQIAWLSDEAMSGSLAGAAQGIADLKTCGAQVAAQRRARETELEIQRARAAAEARAKALADEQLAAVRAQTAAAEAERERTAAEARKAAAEADALAAQAEESKLAAQAERERQARAAAEAERERAYAQYYYPRPAPQPDPYYYRPYYPR